MCGSHGGEEPPGQDAADRTGGLDPLRLEADLYRTFFENAPVGKCMTAPDGRLLRVNKAFCEMLGFTAEEMRTLSFASITHPDDLGESKRCVQSLLAGDEKVWDFEKRYLAKDGHVVWTRVVTRLQRDTDGTPLHFVTHILGIEDRKRAEAQLRAAMTRLAHLNRVVLAIRSINQLIARERDPGRLLQRACDLLVETRGYCGVWAALGQEGHPPTTLAEAGWGDAFERLRCQLAGGVWPDCRSRAGSCDQGILLLEPTEDCRQCPITTSYPHDRAAAMPLRIQGDGVGILAVAVEGDMPLDDEEQHLLVEVAEDLSFGLESIENESKSRYNQRQFERLFETMAQGVVHQDAAGRITAANPAAQRILGLSLDEMLGRTSMDPRWRAMREDGSDFPGEDHYAMVALRTGEPSKGFMGVFDPKAGENRWLRIHAVPETSGEGGRPHGAFTTFDDVTELRAAEAKARHERDRAQQYLDIAGTMLVAIDREGIVQMINPAGCSILGYPAHEIIGKNWFRTFVPPDWRGSVEGLSRAVLAQDPEAERYENPVLTRSGEVRLIAWTNAIIRDESGSAVGHLSSGEDVTERRQAEEQIKAIEHQLAQSQRLESVGRLAGGIAHDFNNLLTVINGSAAFLAEGLPDGDPLLEDIRQIAEAGDRAAKLTHQLLAFSRKQVFKPEVLDLNATIRQMGPMLRRLIGEDIDLRTVLQDDLWLVEADAGQIEQVIMNLAVNARDAMPKGGHLTFETANVHMDETFALRHADVSPGSYVMVAVTDDGVGMPADVRERVFEPFFSTKQATQGTGLGLATVWGIVKQSHGNIWVYSEPGYGTTFKVFLPRARGEAKSERPSTPAPTRVTGTETVLVVEDDAPVRELMARILRSGGYRVLTASSGQQALALCEKEATVVDLLVTDVVMPEMSGRQVAERLAGIVPRLKVLYMSGYTDNAIVHHGVLDEGVRLIAKPFTAEVALRTVRDALDAVEAGAGPGSHPSEVEMADSRIESVYSDYFASLVSGDRVRCHGVVTRLLDAGVPLRSLYVDLFHRSLYAIGEMWEARQVSVAVEHLATAITESLMTLGYPMLFRAEHGDRRAVVACVASEFHQVGAKMVADVFELHGWHSHFYGANTPLADILFAVDQYRPDMVGLSIGLYSHVPDLQRALEALRSDFPNVGVLVGGQAFRWGGHHVVGKSNATYVSSLSDLESLLDEEGR
jgi:two-component system cell cycle sensor histidine kinase/response regulator CckA